MAGGPSSPALAAAVSDAGGLGFLAAGYRTPDQLEGDIARTRELTDSLFGVNLFAATEAPIDDEALGRYAAAIEPLAQRRSVKLGEPRFDDDALDEKLGVVCRAGAAIASFTFGCPSAEMVGRLHGHGIAVWVTVTEVDEGLLAAQVGADALIAQGTEAGGHRGSFEDSDGRGELALLPLLRLLAGATELPLVASGGIADGAGIAAVLAAGASAAQIGTAFMRCPEAATSAPHREALAHMSPTALTRAFSGRRARGIVNAFMRDQDASAPAAYPHVHHLTAPLRAAAREAGDAEEINLWAGQAHALAEERPAAELVRRWSAEAKAALEDAGRRVGSAPGTGEGVEPTVLRPAGISYLRIPAGEPRAAAEFYEAVFGWPVDTARRDPSFQDGTGHVIGHFIPDASVSGEAGVRPYVCVESVDGALERVCANGGAIVEAPYAEGDLWVASFRDPAGNVLGVWQRGPRR